MHILIIQQLLVLPEQSGIDRTYEAAVQWAAAGHRITVLASRAGLPDTLPADFEREGVAFHLVSAAYAHKMSFRRRAQAFVAFWLKAFWRGKSLSKPDVIVAYSPPLPVAWLAYALAKWHRVPFALELGDAWPDVPIGMGIIRNPLLVKAVRWVSGKTFHAAAVIFPFSEGIMQVLYDNYGIKPKKMRLSHNGANFSKTEFIERAAKPTVTVIYAGTIGVANGLWQLVEAARIAHERGRTDVRFLVLGQGNDAAAVQALAVRYALPNMEFLPPVPRHTLQQVLADADIGIISFAPKPYLDTNAANKMGDYAASGLPIVINYEGWQGTWLRRFECGLSSPAGDVAAFAENILRLADSPALRHTFAHNARRMAEIHFDRRLLLEREIMEIHDTISPALK